MLMMMVATTAYGQYPTTKTIKGTRVVIMTLPQAEQIDNKFNLLTDSISLYKRYVNDGSVLIKKLNTERLNLNDSLILAKVNLLNAKNRIGILEEENAKYKRMEFEDKKVQKTVIIGLVSALTIWVTIFITGLSSQ
jgi:hypothetical protein